MLHLNVLNTKLQQSQTEMSHALISHLQRVVERVAMHASELALHCGRKSVTIKDVAQASLPLCVTCENYDVDKNQCSIIQSSRATQQVGGSLPNYDGFCAGYPGQCGIVRNSTCVFSGGSSSRKKRRTMQRRKKKKKMAGTFQYPGFCGSHLTQCMWASEANMDGASATQCTSGGKRRKQWRTQRKPLGRKHRTGGGRYPGFCGDHPTQCAWSDAASAGVEIGSNCTGGNRSRKRSRRLRAKGGSDMDYNTTRILNMKATKEKMLDRYNIRWSNSALQLLQQTLQFHMNEVVSTLRTEDPNTLNIADVSDFLSSYKL